MLCLKVAWIMIFASSALGMPKPPDSERNVRAAPRRLGLDDAARYLRKYGFVSESRTVQTLASIETLDPSVLLAPIRRFQHLAGIEETGILDGETMRYMDMPRCGVEDTVGASSMGSKGYNARGRYEGKKGRRRRGRERRRGGKAKSRTKRYDLQGSWWEKRDLTYAILNWTPDMTRPQIRTAIKKAFNLWASKSTLTFREISDGSKADIKISFGRRSHGDFYSFDGLGGTLAHAFFPQSGEAHFDEDELFSDKGQGTNLHIVAAHEFGHSLGLSHSNVQESLMAPFYQGYVANFELHSDDVAAIQALYGKRVDNKVERPEQPRPRTTKRPRVTRPTKKPRVNVPDICTTNADAAISFMNHSRPFTYIFKGSYYFKIDDDGVMDGYPKKIGKRWRGLPGNLDAAAHSTRTGRTYFFKGDKVYCFQGTQLLRGYPKSAQSMGLPSHVGAVFTWGYDGLLYLFKKKNYYVFDDYKLKTSRPRQISRVWKGLPEGIGAAFTWARNGRTYVVKDNKYWRFNNKLETVDTGYPKSFNRQWLGCSKASPSSTTSLRSSSKGNRRNGRKKNKPRKSR